MEEPGVEAVTASSRNLPWLTAGKDSLYKYKCYAYDQRDISPKMLVIGSALTCAAIKKQYFFAFLMMSIRINLQVLGAE